MFLKPKHGAPLGNIWIRLEVLAKQLTSHRKEPSGRLDVFIPRRVAAAQLPDQAVDLLQPYFAISFALHAWLPAIDITITTRGYAVKTNTDTHV